MRGLLMGVISIQEPIANGLSGDGHQHCIILAGRTLVSASR